MKRIKLAKKMRFNLPHYGKPKTLKKKPFNDDAKQRDLRAPTRLSYREQLIEPMT